MSLPFQQFLDSLENTSTVLDLPPRHCGVAEDDSSELCAEGVCTLEVCVGELGVEEHRAPKV